MEATVTMQRMSFCKAKSCSGSIWALTSFSYPYHPRKIDAAGEPTIDTSVPPFVEAFSPSTCNSYLSALRLQWNLPDMDGYVSSHPNLMTISISFPFALSIAGNYMAPRP